MRQISEFVDWEEYVPGGEDDHGNPVDGWAPAKRVGIYAFDPGTSDEPRRPGHDRVIVSPTLYMPSDVTFGDRDRVTARGRRYDVDGETHQWKHPGGGAIGNVVRLRRTEG